MTSTLPTRIEPDVLATIINTNIFFVDCFICIAHR